MPELPEVETVRRGLQPVDGGRRIVKVEVRRKDLRFPFQKDFVARLDGPDRDRARPPRQIPDGRSRLRRRAADASGHVGLVPRRQGGRPAARRANSIIRAARIARMTMWCFTCRRARPSIFNDPRRFGYMKVIAREAIEDEPLLQGLGPEPLGNEFDAAMLARSCANKKTSLKAALLDQRVVAGLGNIYVCEALFRAQSVAAKAGRDARDQKGRAHRSCAAAGRRHPRGAQPGDQGRRLVAARPSPDLGRTRLFPAFVPGL